MRWLLRLYPAAWRERYGEEFGAVLASQRASVGLVLDVIGGAIDAHFYPQVLTQNNSQNQNSETKQIQRGDTMTLAMLQRCAVGGPRLSRDEKRIATRLAIGTSFVLAMLYLLLTKLYREAPAVQAVIWSAILAPNIINTQMAYLRKRSWLTHAIIVGGGILGMYAFMLAVCLVARRL